jgi:plastocyanin
LLSRPGPTAGNRSAAALRIGAALAFGAALSVSLLDTFEGRSAAAQETPVEVRLVPLTGDEERPFGFEPESVTISAGTTVRWVNTTEVFHTVTFSDSVEERVSNGTFDQSLFAAGATVERTFTGPGTFAYFCQPHSAFMFATISVTEAPSGADILVLGLLATAVVVALAAGLWLRRSHKPPDRETTP